MIQIVLNKLDSLASYIQWCSSSVDDVCEACLVCVTGEETGSPYKERVLLNSSSSNTHTFIETASWNYYYYRYY